MINVMHSLSKPMEKCLDPQLWHACAGGMAQIPPPNSKVYYFCQGHGEHANARVDFMKFPRIPPLILCRVASIKYLADSESDEVYAKIRLMPLGGDEPDVCDEESGFVGLDKSEEREKTNSFAKTLTQSDANNGGGFSVPRYCAETIFPRLDYSAEPPVQTILAKDVHGVVWKFRHIYRGTPRRHLLTTGWSNFVNQKKLVAGDSIVFLRAENGDLCVGIRRAKRGIGGGAEVSCGWNTGGLGFSGFLGENVVGLGIGGGGRRELGLKERGNVKAEAVVEAASLAANGQAFEVVYYPRAGSPEFVVRESAVKAAMRVQWCSGMRFKMAFETEDSSRISWFMGTISSVQVDDSIHWPNSPWRLLQVVWDEPDLLQNVKRVNPWLVELVSTMPMPAVHHHLSPFSPPRKRPRLPTLVTNPLSPSSPLCPAGLQGARHAHFQLPQLQPFDFKLLHYGSTYEPKTPVFLLFGQPILTAEQISHTHSIDTEPNSSDGNQDNTANTSNASGSALIQNFPPEASSDGEFPGLKDHSLQCKVLVESEDVGRTLDLPMLGSFEGLHSHVWHGEVGDVKQRAVHRCSWQR
ncbi:auxin response factor 16 [Perilla frutescens var. frutescens]|nr:auxin response factor 16 [Perilla frutescens var. frutescens]